MSCWLARYDTKHRSCQGRTDRAHLIAAQTLRKEHHAGLVDDPRSWVPACRFHHQGLDGFLGVVVPRADLPVGLEELAEEADLDWWLDRRYGLLDAPLERA